MGPEPAFHGYLVVRWNLMGLRMAGRSCSLNRASADRIPHASCGLVRSATFEVALMAAHWAPLSLDPQVPQPTRANVRVAAAMFASVSSTFRSSVVLWEFHQATLRSYPLKGVANLRKGVVGKKQKVWYHVIM